MLENNTSFKHNIDEYQAVEVPLRTSKVRGNYCRRVKNTNPSYTLPAAHEKRPPFIKELIELSMTRDILKSDGAMYTRSILERQKAYYADRAKAMSVLFTVFAYHVNLVTHQIEISLRNASDAAGLSTVSAAELKKASENSQYTPVVSISRTSRATQDMVALGWIVAPDEWQIWDKERGYWIDKYYEATPAFFAAVGITHERVDKQQNDRLKYLKHVAKESGMSEASVGRMSITQIKAERKLAWRRNAFDRRAKEQSRSKIKRELEGKSRTEQRSVAVKNVLTALGDDVHNVSQGTFADMVNKEIATLRKFANLKPPLH